MHVKHRAKKGLQIKTVVGLLLMLLVLVVSIKIFALWRGQGVKAADANPTSEISAEILSKCSLYCARCDGNPECGNEPCKFETKDENGDSVQAEVSCDQVRLQRDIGDGS